jgi:hypothetical protein
MGTSSSGGCIVRCEGFDDLAPVAFRALGSLPLGGIPAAFCSEPAAGEIGKDVPRLVEHGAAYGRISSSIKHTSLLSGSHERFRVRHRAPSVVVLSSDGSSLTQPAP